MEVATNNTSFFNELFSKLNEYQLSYAYKGDFTKHLTDNILELAETGMQTESENNLTKKKVYFIMVESLQNITRHQGTPETRMLEGFFSMNKHPSGYLITSGNIVENKDIDVLKQKLDKVNSLDGAQLKELYQEMLAEGSFSSKGGAGLGLIEMARKSGNKLTYHFEAVNADFSYFYFQCNIANKNAEQLETSVISNTDTLAVTMAMHKTVVDHNLKLFYHGQFGHENIKSILKMTEGSSFETDNVLFRKTTFAIMIEMLQNICYHGISKNENENEKPGLFMVSEHENYIELITGNYIHNAKLNLIETRIDYVNKLNTHELEALFLEVIVKEKNDNSPGAGLGFIDIRMKTGNNIRLNTQPYNNELTFITIKTTINF
jgi:hypothetical protein